MAKSVAEEFKKETAMRDREGLLSVAELDLFSQSGLWGLTVPKAYGGSRVSYATLGEVIKILAAADPVRARRCSSWSPAPCCVRPWKPAAAFPEHAGGLRRTHMGVPLSASRRPTASCSSMCRTRTGWSPAPWLGDARSVSTWRIPAATLTWRRWHPRSSPRPSGRTLRAAGRTRSAACSSPTGR